MPVPARSLGEPGLDQLGPVAGGVVHHDMDVEVVRHIRLDGVEEAAELGSAVARPAAADDGAGLDVQRGEQRGRAVAPVVVGAPLGLPRAQRQHRLGAVERLDPVLLVGTQHQRALRRAEMEADDVAHLLDKQRIGRELEGPDPVRPQRGRLADALHRGGRERGGPGHAARTPVGPPGRQRLKCGGHHLGHLLVRGAPGRGSSGRPSRRRAAKRPRRAATVARATPSRSVMARLVNPAAASSTISARSASPRATFRRRCRASNSARSSSDNSIRTAFGVGIVETLAPINANSESQHRKTG